MRTFGWFLLLVACGDADTEGDTGAATVEDCATEDEARCDGDMLQICTDGAWLDDTDCAEGGQMCHEEMGHCMTM